MVRLTPTADFENIMEIMLTHPALRSNTYCSYTVKNIYTFLVILANLTNQMRVNFTRICRVCVFYGTVSLDSSDTRRRGWGSDTQGRSGEGGGRTPLPARAGRDGAADPVRVAGALKL